MALSQRKYAELSCLEIKVLKKTYGPDKEEEKMQCRKLHDEINTLYSSQDITIMVRLRRMR